MKLALLFADMKLTRIMQGCDVFEKSKVIREPLAIATLDGTKTKKQTADAVRAVCGTERTLLAAFDGEAVYYRDESVKSVSDGQEWCTLDDFISATQSRFM